MADGSGDVAAHTPSGVTATAAAVLMLLLGLWHLLGLVVAVVNLVHGDAEPILLLAGLGANAIVATLLLGGAAAVLARRPAGRAVGALGCVLAVATYVTLALQDAYGTAMGSELAALVILVVPSLAAFVLILLPSSERWLSRDRPKPPSPRYRPDLSGGPPYR